MAGAFPGPENSKSWALRPIPFLHSNRFLNFEFPLR